MLTVKAERIRLTSQVRGKATADDGQDWRKDKWLRWRMTEPPTDHPPSSTHSSGKSRAP